MRRVHFHQAEAFSREVFHCGSCSKDFSAKVITWIDASRSPHVKESLLRWQFNIVECPHCGCRQVADTPFFYEDFEEGLLIAHFPKVPEGRGTVEAAIREKYGYYPVLEFFYDMAQIWTLLYLQDHYRTNRNLRSLSRIGEGEDRLRKILRFLKEDPLMLEVREKLTESQFGDASEDELVELFARVVATIEEMLPWPLDRKCICGADLSRELKCCGKRVTLDDHQRLLSRHYIVYCPVCGEAISGASCDACGRVYTWRLGTVSTYRQGRGSAERRSPKRGAKAKHSPRISQYDH